MLFVRVDSLGIFRRGKRSSVLCKGKRKEKETKGQGGDKNGGESHCEENTAGQRIEEDCGRVSFGPQRPPEEKKEKTKQQESTEKKTSEEKEMISYIGLVCL